MGDTAVVTPLDHASVRELAVELVKAGGSSVKILTGGSAYQFEVPVSVAQELGYAPKAERKAAAKAEPEKEPEEAPVEDKAVPEVEVAEPKRRGRPRKTADES